MAMHRANQVSQLPLIAAHIQPRAGHQPNPHGEKEDSCTYGVRRMMLNSEIHWHAGLFANL